MFLKKIIIPYTEWTSQLNLFFKLGFLKKYDVYKACALMLLVTFFEAVSVATFIPLLEILQSGNTENISNNSSVWWKTFNIIYGLIGQKPNIFLLSCTIVIFVCLRQLFNFLNTVNLMRLKHRVGRDMAVTCVSGILKSKPSYIQNFKTGSFVNTIDHQAQAAATLLRAFATLFGIAITVAAYLAVMFLTAPLASLTAIMIMVLIIVSVEKWVKVGLNLSKEVISFREQYINFLTDRHRNWRAIKTSSAEEKEISLASDYANKFYHYGVNMAKNSGKNLLVVSPLMIIFSLSVLYISVSYFHLSISEIAIFILILVRLVPVAQNMANQRQMVAAYQPSLMHIKKVIEDTENSLENLDDGKVFDISFKFINISNLVFRYPRAKNKALNNFNCKIPANKKTAIIGKSGSGKSTMTDLIARLHTPSKGFIKFDEQPSELFSIKSIRKRITYVSQQPLIFSASVKENVSYVRPDATHDEIINSCKAANAHSFIEDLPNKYNETLHEGGTNLSGGERQRIMLARAFLAATDIIILDEATSSVDFESEDDINDALNLMTQKRDMTVIIIAHRVSTIKNVDHLIIMDNGKLVDQGAPEDLKYDDNWYTRMMDH